MIVMPGLSSDYLFQKHCSYCGGGRALPVVGNKRFGTASKDGANSEYSFVPLTLFLLPRSSFQENAASSVRIIVIFQDSLMQTRLSARFAPLLPPSISLKGTFYFSMSALIFRLILRSIEPTNPAAYASVLRRNASATSQKAGGRRGHSGWTEIGILVFQLR
jgi:hypothetical protein